MNRNSLMMFWRTFTCLALFAGFSITAPAANLYVAQNATGAGSGSDPNNAHALAWANTGTNWGSGAGKINPGDVVHLVGAFTNQFIIQGSGAPNAPITVFFEPNARFSAPTWNGGVDNAAIACAGKSWITIDGGTNGLIEATDNGTSPPFTYSGDSIGVFIDLTVHDWIVKNLVITNMYRRTTTTDAVTNGGGYAVEFVSGGYNITVSNCKSYNVRRHINLGYVLGSSNYFIMSNTVVTYSEGLRVGNANSAGTLTNCQIYANEISDAGTWSGVSTIHCDGLHVFSVASSTSYVSGLRCFGNYCHGNPGAQSTALLYFEGSIDAPLVYNNLLVDDGPGYPDVGYLDLKGCSNAIAANNTFVSLVPTNFGNAIALQSVVGNEKAFLTNNLMYQTHFGVYQSTANQVAGSDYNVFYPGSMGFSTNASLQNTWTQWRAAGYDAHGQTNLPLLLPNFTPSESDTVANARALPLTMYFAVDKNNGARPQSAWTVGAYEPRPSAPQRVHTVAP